MEERGRGKRNMHSEKNKDERDRQLEAMTEEERDEYFREMRRERRLRRQKGAPEEAGGSGRHSSDFPCCSSWRSQRDHTFCHYKSSGSGIVSNKDENKKAGEKQQRLLRRQTFWQRRI